MAGSGRQRAVRMSYQIACAKDIETANPLFTEWGYLYVLFGKNFVDNVEYPLEAAVSEEDYNEFSNAMDKQRQQLLFQAPDHRRFLDSLREKGTEAWYRP